MSTLPPISTILPIAPPAVAASAPALVAAPAPAHATGSSEPLASPTATAAAAPDSASENHRIDCRLGYELDGPCHFLFMVQATVGMGQRVLDESLTIEPPQPFRSYTDPQSGNRFLRVQAAGGPMRLRYRARIERQRGMPDPQAPEMPVDELPDALLHHLMPTRYCESDHLGPATQKMFGALPPGHARVQAISDWIHDNVEYRLGSSDATTTARDVFVRRAGVCRDFAHLGVTFCRALNIPARLVCGYSAFEEPPPDFHAIFEAYLGGQWVMFDPTGLAPVERLIRVATGRDAKDVAFCTIFGPARMTEMSPEIELETDGGNASGGGSGDIHRTTAPMLQPSST